MRIPIMVLFMATLAGCLSDGPSDHDDSLLGLDESAPFQLTPLTADGAQRLSNLTREELLQNAATFHVPAGQWASIRTILTMEMWGESGTWDGESMFYWTIAVNGIDGARADMVNVIQDEDMDGSAFDRRYLSHVFDLEGGEAHTTGLYGIGMIGGDPSQYTPPRDEPAWFIGSPSSDLDVRFMVHEEYPEDLPPARESLDITPDAYGQELHAAGAWHTWQGDGTLEGSDWGPLAMTDTGASGYTVDVDRTIAVKGAFNASYSGTMFAAGNIRGTEALKDWSYSIDAGPQSQSDQGRYYDGRSGTVLGATGEKDMRFRHDLSVPSGENTYHMQATLTGFGDTPALRASPAVDADLVFISVDFATLYGWPAPANGVDQGDMEACAEGVCRTLTLV